MYQLPAFLFPQVTKSQRLFCVHVYQAQNAAAHFAHQNTVVDIAVTFLFGRLVLVYMVEGSRACPV